MALDHPFCVHSLASLYEEFPSAEARRIAEKFELHFTPEHGSWLNIAEIKLSAYKRQCVAGRIDSVQRMREMTRAWTETVTPARARCIDNSLWTRPVSS